MNQINHIKIIWDICRMSFIGLVGGLVIGFIFQYLSVYIRFINYNFELYYICHIINSIFGMIIGLTYAVSKIHHKKRMVISIEGNIGSGKSTLINYLKMHLGTHLKNEDIVFLPEPVAEWETIRDTSGKTMLENFYEDQKKYSFPFQIMAYATRRALIQNAIRNNPNSIIITERCLRTDRQVFLQMLYDTNLIESMMYQIYIKLFDTSADDCPIDRTIYISATSDICHDRICKRNRSGENNISIDYLEKCNLYHDRMMDDVIQNNQGSTINHLILDGNIDCHKNIKQLDIWTTQIIRFINQSN